MKRTMQFVKANDETGTVHAVTFERDVDTGARTVADVAVLDAFVTSAIEAVVCLIDFEGVKKVTFFAGTPVEEVVKFKKRGHPTIYNLRFMRSLLCLMYCDLFGLYDDDGAINTDGLGVPVMEAYLALTEDERNSMDYGAYSSVLQLYLKS